MVDFKPMFDGMTTASLLALSDAASKEAARRIGFAAGGSMLPNAGAGKMSEARRREFLEASPLGQRILREEREAARR